MIIDILFCHGYIILYYISRKRKAKNLVLQIFKMLTIFQQLK